MSIVIAQKNLGFQHGRASSLSACYRDVRRGSGTLSAHWKSINLKLSRTMRRTYISLARVLTDETVAQLSGRFVDIARCPRLRKSLLPVRQSIEGLALTRKQVLRSEYTILGHIDLEENDAQRPTPDSTSYRRPLDAAHLEHGDGIAPENARRGRQSLWPFASGVLRL